MSFKYEEKKFIVMINKYNANIEKDKINLISITKANLLKYNNKKKNFLLLFMKEIYILKIQLSYLEKILLEIIIN